jgi:hypothetical protein
MSIINEIKYQVRIQASNMLHDSENIPLDVWCEARVIQDYAEPLLDTCRIIQDQMGEDLEDAYEN